MSFLLIMVPKPTTMQNGSMTKDERTDKPAKNLDAFADVSAGLLVNNRDVSMSAAAAKQDDIKYPLLSDQYSDM